MNRDEKSRDGMLEEYRESLDVTSRGTLATKFMTKTGYVRHAQITTWWEALIAALMLAAILFAVLRWIGSYVFSMF